jgi:hypothetical protein
MRKMVFGAMAVAICAVALGACGSSSSSSGSDVTAFCDKVNELKQLSNPFASVKPGDVQGAKDAVDKIRSEVQSIDDVAPDAVKADVEKVKTTLDDFATKIAGADTPAQLVAAAQSFQAQATTLQATTAKLKAYTNKNCGKS